MNERSPRGIRPLIGLVAATLVFCFVTVSCAIATLPQFQFESQFGAVLPFFLWAAAPGVGSLSVVARRLRTPWVKALGWVSLVPYAAVMLIEASIPQLVLPWWSGLVAAGCAALPFVIGGLRQTRGWPTRGVRSIDPSARHGLFFLVVALMLMTYGASAEQLSGAVIEVLLASALFVASLRRHGLADAARAWTPRQWVALLWGSVVVWATTIVSTLTGWLDSVWAVLGAVVLAGLPLLIVGRTPARGDAVARA